MQAEYGKFVPRSRKFQQINAAAPDRLKAEWIADPSNMVQCSNERLRIWEIHDLRMSAWVSVCLATNFCCCGSDKQVCQHIELARHIAAGNRSDQVQPIASDTALQLVTVQSQHAQSSADREAAMCRRKINRVCQVINPAHVTFDALTYHQRDMSVISSHGCMQAIQSADLCLVSHSELSPVLRQLQQCYNQIIQAAAAPPIDAAIVQGTVAEVTGLQKSHKR